MPIGGIFFKGTIFRKQALKNPGRPDVVVNAFTPITWEEDTGGSV